MVDPELLLSENASWHDLLHIFHKRSFDLICNQTMVADTNNRFIFSNDAL